MRRRLVLTCTVLMGGAVLAACGGDKDPTPVAVTITQAGGGGALTMSAPDSVESGAVEIRFQNQAQGPSRLELIGVEGTHTADEILEVIQSDGGPIPAWFKPAGGVGATGPGQTATATVEVDEGTYFLIGEVDSEDDSEPAPATKMLMATGDGGASLPSADTTITAKEYVFEVGELKAGANEVRFQNDGKEIHILVAARMAPGKTIDDVRAALAAEGEPEGPPPLDFDSAVDTGVLDAGKSLVTTLNLKSGKYAFICFIQDRAGGPPHAAKGMLQEVTIA